MDKELLYIGEIIKAHGIRGEVKVLLDHPDSTILSQVKKVLLQNGSTTRELSLSVARKAPTCSIVRFAEVTDRDQAEALEGLLLVKKDTLPAIEDGEIYLYQLEGKRAVTRLGEDLGVVEGFLENNTKTAIMVIRGKRGEYLLPVIPDVVLAVHEETNTVTIDLLEGFEPSE